MRLRFHPMSAAAAAEIAGWTYAPPWALYNHALERQTDVAASMMDPANAYERVSSEDVSALAIWCAGPDARVPGLQYPSTAVDIGLGIHPDQTGQGFGREIGGAVVQRARQLHPGEPLRVTVAEHNGRALHLWTQLGFTARNRPQPGDREAFVLLVREPSAGWHSLGPDREGDP